MNNKILKVLNPLLFICFLVTLTSMLLYKLPGRFQYSELAVDLHTWFGIAFFILAILHIYLNWSWIRLNILGRKTTRKKGSV